MSEMDHNNFYVGYFPKAPIGLVRVIRFSIIVIFLSMGFTAFMVVVNQAEFAPSTFEYGTYTELSGELISKPYPMLKVGSAGNKYSQSLILVNFGKKGVVDIIQSLEGELGDLGEYQFRIRGTLIYYDGKTALEMSDGRASVISWSKAGLRSKSQVKSLGEKTLIGEIVDPKCFLGVMKPAAGKIHQSCARRCISGGIPPVLVVQNDQGESNYLLITDPEGNPLHHQLIAVIGPQVTISGKVEQLDDWLVIKTDPATQIISQFSLKNQIGQLLTYLSPGTKVRCKMHPGLDITLCM